MQQHRVRHELAGCKQWSNYKDRKKIDDGSTLLNPAIPGSLPRAKLREQQANLKQGRDSLRQGVQGGASIVGSRQNSGDGWKHSALDCALEAPTFGCCLSAPLHDTADDSQLCIEDWSWSTSALSSLKGKSPVNDFSLQVGKLQAHNGRSHPDALRNPPLDSCQAVLDLTTSRAVAPHDEGLIWHLTKICQTGAIHSQ